MIFLAWGTEFREGGCPAFRVLAKNMMAAPHQQTNSIFLFLHFSPCGIAVSLKNGCWHWPIVFTQPWTLTCFEAVYLLSIREGQFRDFYALIFDFMMVWHLLVKHKPALVCDVSLTDLEICYQTFDAKASDCFYKGLPR